jgi:hypothetical protein
LPTFLIPSPKIFFCATPDPKVSTFPFAAPAAASITAGATALMILLNTPFPFRTLTVLLTTFS